MLAYKLKGKIASSGQLIVTEPINLSPGEVEVIILQQVAIGEVSPISATTIDDKTPKKIVKFGVKSLKELLETAPPIPPDFDLEQARWDALKEKHDL